MSISAVLWASKQSLKPNDKLVLWALCDHKNESTGKCFPSTERICEFTGLSKRSVHRSIKSLESIGLIEAKKRPGTSTIYMLNITEMADDVPDSHQCHTVTSARQSLEWCHTVTTPVPHSHHSGATQAPKPGSNQEVNQEVNQGDDVSLDKNKKDKKQPPKTIKDLNLPEWLDMELWEAWIQHRRKIKAPVTYLALNGHIKTLVKIQSENGKGNEALLHSYSNGYKGIFQPRDFSKPSNETQRRSRQAMS